MPGLANIKLDQFPGKSTYTQAFKALTAGMVGMKEGETPPPTSVVAKITISNVMLAQDNAKREELSNKGKSTETYVRTLKDTLDAANTPSAKKSSNDIKPELDSALKSRNELVEAGKKSGEISKGKRKELIEDLTEVWHAENPTSAENEKKLAEVKTACESLHKNLEKEEQALDTVDGQLRVIAVRIHNALPDDIKIKTPASPAPTLGGSKTS